ncbi:hypothetical protein CVT25_010033 [Psilocybe cyanescens]|uniref:Uncharacterized protein n=1 Tax=Psilocybe cyanescens TaxID=93625 RepID=A0A409X3E4_PSICY|nr:hypothetical protein CVT25_010033 [Psilocybe cyanescens]
MVPLSKADFNSKRTETKLRAGIFLVADPARQERLLNDYGWACRQVQPLIDIFKKDPERDGSQEAKTSGLVFRTAT